MTLSLVLLATALSAGNADFDRAALEGAARVSLDRKVAELVGAGLPRGALAAAQLADPAKAKTRRDAEALAWPVYAAQLDAALDAAADAVRERLSLPEAFDLAARPEDRAALSNQFAAVFAAERADAVREQAKGLVTTLRPTEEEFETKDEAVLREEMTARVIAEQRVPVFEENTRYITEQLVEPTLKAAKAERARQETYVSRARSESSAPSAIRADLLAKLTANLAEKAKGADPTEAWGIFPSVRDAAIPREAERRATRRFAREIDEISPALGEDDFARLLAEDPGAHAKASESDRIFSARASAEILSAARERSLAESSDAEREELADFLERESSSDATRKAVERVVRRDVRPKWRAARAAFAKRLTERVWPTLVDGTWCPDPELADDFASRGDFDAAVKAWRKRKELRSLAAPEGASPLLEESRAAADAFVAKAFSRARDAIAAQGALVDAAEAPVLAEARTEGLAVDAVARRLRERVKAAWAEKREGVLWPDGAKPANAAEQHADLFPSVERKIDLVARQILEDIEQPEPDAPVLPEDEVLSLALRRTEKGIEVRLTRGHETLRDSLVPPTAGDFRAAMSEVVDILARIFFKPRE